jgi:pre-mRNA-splicing factor SYF2
LRFRSDRRKEEFSRRRRYNDGADVDFINDRNAHFNKKIQRAFGQYTSEIKANLERGTALPDR